MSTNGVLAIDFGTTNTYYCKCPSDQLSPTGIDFRDGRDGLATAIMYRLNKSPLIGHIALEAYGDATENERKNYKLRSHFKPDISLGQEAKTYAIDFLSAVLKESKCHRVDIDPESRHVIFGVPSEANEDYRKALCEVAQQAGYGKIRLIDEPKGALLYHLFHKDIPVRDAQRGMLVVDFGGGTCDFAFLERGSVRHSWGDMNLGGRLFDDLFFQWFIDDNPGSLETIKKEGNEYFVHFYLCREIKEYFSRTMARDRKEKIPKAVRHYGYINNMTWETFLHKASSYKPSQTLKSYLNEIGQSNPSFNSGIESIDLLGWFRNCLRDGLKSANIEISDIRFVILAGGSSQWPFVTDILEDELYIESNKIMRSDRPYAAISEGIAILPALQSRFNAIQTKLRNESPEFLEKKLKPLLNKRFEDTSQKIARSATRELFDNRIKPLFFEFRANGGSIVSLRQKIKNITLSYEPEFQKLLDENQEILIRGLVCNIKEMMNQWFDEHGLVPYDDNLQVKSKNYSEIERSDVELPDFYDNLVSTPLFLLGGVLLGLIENMERPAFDCKGCHRSLRFMTGQHRAA